MKRLFLLAALLAAVLVLTCATAAWAATYYVAPTGSDSPGNGSQTSPFLTIQYAIDNASDGDIINVAPGTYNESITIDKSLTLLGAQDGVDPVAGGRTGGESTIDAGGPDNMGVTITASDVTFSGFELTDYFYGVWVAWTGFDAADNYTLSNITISYDYIHDDNGYVGFTAEPGTLDRLTITHNMIDVGSSSYAEAAIAFSDASGYDSSIPPATYDNVEISYNDLQDPSGRGLFVGADPSTYLINGMVIKGNYFHNAHTDFNLGNITNGSLADNLVADGGVIGIEGTSSNPAIISGNTFPDGSWLELFGMDWGFPQPSTYVTVENNAFGANSTFYPDGTGINLSTIHVNWNSFATPTVPQDPSTETGYQLCGPAGGGNAPLDATENWWDSSTGPDSDYFYQLTTVNASPWITAYQNDLSKGGPTDWPLNTAGMPTQLGFWPIPITLTMTGNPNPSTSGQNVIFTATVSPATATGSVEFFDGSTSLGSATLVGGTCSVSTSALSVGTHTINAVYSGSGDCFGSTSASLSQVVNQALAATTTTVKSCPNPSTYGQSVKFTATVSPSAATGTVTFYDGSTVLGTVKLSHGSASLTTSSLSAGTHLITAVYSGDTNYATSTGTLTQTVKKVSTATTLKSCPNPSTYGKGVTFTATVSPLAATGTVTFKDGGIVLGTVTLSHGSATLTTSALAVGSHSITAVYSGDVNYATSTSHTLMQTVKKACSKH